MTEDRSLDEFEAIDGEAGSDAPATDPDTPNAAAGDAGGGDAAQVTTTWTTDGADCERCGDRTERRWLDDGDRVCPECKSW